MTRPIVDDMPPAGTPNDPDRENFEAQMYAFTLAFTPFVAQVNALAEWMNALVGGGDDFIPAERISLVTVTGTSHNLDADNDSGYHRFTSSDDKTCTVRPNSTHELPANGSWVFRNIGAGDLTIVAGSGVTINAPYGGTLVMLQGMTATLQKVGTDAYDLIGQTEPST